MKSREGSLSLGKREGIGALTLGILVCSLLPLFFAEAKGGSVFSFLLCAGMAAIFALAFAVCKEARLWGASFIMGLAFSAAMLLGYSFEKTNSYGLIFKSGANFFRAFLAGMALTLVATAVVALLFVALQSLYRQTQEERAMTEKQIFARVFLLVFLCYLPYYIAYFPGTNIWDTQVQLAQFDAFVKGGEALSDHHPALLSALYWLFIRTGIALGDANIGQALYGLCAMLAYASAYAFAAVCMKRVQTPLRVVRGAAIFSALYPVYALYSFNMSKDASFVPVFVVFTALMLCVEHTDGKIFSQKHFTKKLFFLCLLMLLMRKAALYILLVAFVLMLLRYKGVRGRICLALGGAMACFAVYSVALLPALGVAPGPATEMLSVPFQQTARFVRTYPEDVTAQEAEAIDRVLDMSTLAQRYDPQLSDPVKYGARDFTGEEFAAYLRVWARQFLRHPGCYVEAFVNGTYGFFYAAEATTITCTTLTAPIDTQMDISPPQALAGARGVVYAGINEVLRQVPGISMLFYVGTLMWLSILLAVGLALRTGSIKSLTPFGACLGTVLICLLSPKNGEIRYFLPVVSVLPMLLSYAAGQKGKRHTAGGKTKLRLDKAA